MKTLAFDPGGITGVCGWHSDEGVVMQSQIATETRHNVEIYATLMLIKPDKVISERFDNDGNPAAELISRNYIGVIELWCDQYDVPLVMSSRENMVFWSDDKLKKTGLYKPGLPHANDATRHMLWWLTFTEKDHHYLHMLQS